MGALDTALNFLLLALILLHLFVAPYTKVEESFNIQATHDFLTYPRRSLSFDHHSFPGAVPRTFIGAVVLSVPIDALISVLREFDQIVSGPSRQLLARGFLGLLNAGALVVYKKSLARVAGRDAGRWWMLLLLGQFHVIFYASRTLPNMFAFPLTTLALSVCPPAVNFRGSWLNPRHAVKLSLAIFLFACAGVIFRAEVALLLFTQLAFLLAQRPRPNAVLLILRIIFTGLGSVMIVLPLSVAFDTGMWKRIVWPEGEAFYFNAIQGNSADWGTSPYSFYFVNALPRLLLNPLIMTLLIPISFLLPGIKRYAVDLLGPTFLFVAIYSLQPHKEARFIIYVVPALTAAAALSASYIWTRRSKGLVYRLGSLLLVTSVIGSFAASTGMLLISSLNYPGGDAIAQLNTIIRGITWDESEYGFVDLPHDLEAITRDTPLNHPPTGHFTEKIHVHMDVLSCMTGVTRFQQLPLVTMINGRHTWIHYDKTENSTELLKPDFWDKFDYALMEDPGLTIGAWEVIGTAYAYAGLEILQPGEGENVESVEDVYLANTHTTRGDDGLEKPLNSEEVREALEDVEVSEKGKTTDPKDVKIPRVEKGIFGIYNAVKESVRTITCGWWVGPRMRPAIRILRRVKKPTGV